VKGDPRLHGSSNSKKYGENVEKKLKKKYGKNQFAVVHCYVKILASAHLLCIVN
jgi:hypothetical protein